MPWLIVKLFGSINNICSNAQVAVEPKALVVYSRMNSDCKLIVQDSSSLCAEGEELSYATLQLRAQAVDQACSIELFLSLSLLIVSALSKIFCHLLQPPCMQSIGSSTKHACRMLSLIFACPRNVEYCMASDYEM